MLISKARKTKKNHTLIIDKKKKKNIILELNISAIRSFGSEQCWILHDTAYRIGEQEEREKKLICRKSVWSRWDLSAIRLTLLVSGSCTPNDASAAAQWKPKRANNQIIPNELWLEKNTIFGEFLGKILRPWKD